MRIGIPKEIGLGEHRVAGTPLTVERLVKAGFEVHVQRGAGTDAEHTDDGYTEVGATIVDDVRALWGTSDIVLKVDPPAMNEELGLHEADMMKEGACLIGFLWPAQNEALIKQLCARKISALAMDRVPRITRAQKVDALSAMANAAGYRAVVEAAAAYPRFFAGQSTAAGAIRPAKVLVIGGGVAGLAAIGAARSLGAIVRAFDTRPEVGEQVRSMGAEFLDLKVPAGESADGGGGYAKVMSPEYIEAEMKLFAKQAMEVNIIITTALIPGKPAPKLITSGMVESMREGSVIVDLAAQQGGNCTLTVPGKMVRHAGVRIIGYTDLASRMAIQSSWLYASTLVNLIDEMGSPDEFKVDFENEIVRGALVAHGGEVVAPSPPKQPPRTSVVEPDPSRAAGKAGAARAPDSARTSVFRWVGLLVAAIAIVAVGRHAPESFLSHFTVFVLACFVGWQVVWAVTPALHTPLMSVTNAISGIIIIGGMLQLSGDPTSVTSLLGAVAVFVAAINIAGGFLVTRRMLAMFRK